ncbi:MAG: glycine cleavage system aminomethyltransferase GcvT [Myxococcota bacterium]|nr:glycine cleavage system aminomethyltransferase GcvT [Myxococcota bacterium]
MKKTPLYARHEDAGGRFVEFGGWSMPVRYTTSIQDEHATVRTAVGVFDVSHMGEIEITGSNALEATNRLIANDLERIVDGQALYTPLCRPDGGIVDDLVVYRFSRERIFICCNAANREKDFAWIQANLQGATAQDRGDEFGQLAVQGPDALACVQALTETDLDSIGRYYFADGQVAGVPTIISRTGYTGEDGFELYVPAERVVEVWDALFSVETHQPRPIGLGARDTLRLEMKYALYGNDIDDTTTPLEAGIGWATKLDKADFIGREALVAQKARGLERRLVAFVMDGRAIARHGYAVVDDDGHRVGRVTSGTRSPTSGANIGLAYVPMGRHRVGMTLNIQVRNRVETATIVKPPFVTPGSSKPK